MVVMEKVSENWSKGKNHCDVISLPRIVSRLKRGWCRIRLFLLSIMHLPLVSHSSVVLQSLSHKYKVHNKQADLASQARVSLAYLSSFSFLHQINFSLCIGPFLPQTVTITMYILSASIFYFRHSPQAYSQSVLTRLVK